MKKNLLIGTILLIIGVVIAVTIGAFYYLQNPMQNSPSPIASPIDGSPAATLSPSVSNSTSPSPSVENDEALKEKIGQMLLLGFRGTAISENSQIKKTISDAKIGGVILFDYDAPSKSYPRNITSPAQVKKLITDLQAASTIPLLVSVDAEGGSVLRLQPKYGFVSIPSAQTMGQDTTLKSAQQNAQKLATELKDLGFNMDFAPVVDVNVNPQNPVIGGLGRSFSADPKVVTDNARVFINIFNQNKIIPVEKHFPGHGSSTADSHLGLVDVTKTYQQKELNPYIQLQKEGLLDVVMTAHIVNQNVDVKYPATLSPKFIQDILRNQVGFKGVVISDDMQMNAIAAEYGFEDAIVRAINAGCDILLLSNNGSAPYDPQLAQKAAGIIVKAIKDGKISEDKINQSYERIMNLKKKFGIIN